MCEIKDFSSIIMPDTVILEFNQYHKPEKAPATIYADL